MTDLIILDEVRGFVEGIDQSPCDGCDLCGARCVAGVPMLRVEFEAVREFLAGPEGEEAVRVERQEKRLPYPGTEDVFYTACRFRDVERGRCSIYPVRPAVCRMFGHVEWLPCPVGIIPAPVPGGIQTMRRYGEAPLRTYEEWLADLPSAPETSAAP